MLVGAAITIGHWCRTITALGDGGLEWVVITCDRLEKIKGHTWDVIIADEAHALRPTATKGWKVWATVSGQARPHDTAPFVISTTATPGHTPLELPYLAPAYAQVLGEPMREWTSATHPGARFASALERHGVGAGPDLRDAGRAHAGEAECLRGRVGEFCPEMDLARRGRSVAKGRAALLRFRQKAGLIPADSTVAWIAQQVQSERQVEFVTTAAETLPDGRHASTDPRVGIFHQARFSGIAARQVTGRTHRDHQVSPWQVAYAESTVEEQVGKMMVERIAAASDSVGSDTTGLTELAQLLGADWLPPATMTAHDT